MKKRLLCLALLSSLLLSSCNSMPANGDNEVTYEEGYYLVGMGSFINGANWSVSSGVMFTEVESVSEDIYSAYYIQDLSLEVGDAFKVEYYPSLNAFTYYDLTSEAFSLDYVKISSTDECEVDVKVSGEYSIALVISTSGEFNISIYLGSSFSSSESHVKEEIEGSVTIDLYANGDQHGVIEAGSGYVSYPTYITYIKKQMEGCDNPVLISNGDLWQGTYESNIYYGKVLTELLDVAGYSAMTLGNHEFDWGQDVIRENASLTNTPFLGANIVKYENGHDTDTLVDYVDPYKIVETDSGLTVGIIGVIGPDQWSSITSSYVSDISFINPVTPIKTYSDKLRVDFDVDIVVASFHAGTDDATEWIRELGNDSDATGRPYIDAAFTSHDHYYTTGEINGVPYANSGNKNARLSHIQLVWDSGKVSTSKKENLNTSSLSSSTYKEDKEARELIDSVITDADKVKADEVEGRLGSEFKRYCYNGEYGPRLVSKAMYSYVSSEGYDVVCAFVNDTRAKLPSGNVTYANILEAVPFFNKTVIMDVRGSVLKNELNYAYGSKGRNISVMYYAPRSVTIKDNEIYRVAAYDYLAYHMNTSRRYNYFTDFTVIAELDMWPADYIASYMNSFSGTINMSDFPDSYYTCLS
ncbi:MAG: 5'-nucleotidase C-terminal domain-containing protein [Coprobacillus sp.]|nr:5'-nucleotidase C-terminal domain-containing protein [Coprobacillus sp.]